MASFIANLLEKVGILKTDEEEDHAESPLGAVPPPAGAESLPEAEAEPPAEAEAEPPAEAEAEPPPEAGSPPETEVGSPPETEVGSPPETEVGSPPDTGAGEAEAALAPETHVALVPETDTQGEAPQPTRTLTLSELMSEAVDRNAGEREVNLARDMGLDVAWKTIFDTAGIVSPTHGWTVEKSLAFIRKAQSKGMTPVQVRRSLEQALVNDGADVREVARDAVAKDEVLDTYEQALEDTVGANLEELDAEVRAIEAQIDDLRERIADIEEQRASTLRRLTAWKSEKRHLEQQWAKVLQVIAPLVKPS
jgi:hypothetical protein